VEKTVKERIAELCKLLPEGAQEEMRWLLDGAHFKERPRGHERLAALCEVLPASEAEELGNLFSSWEGDFEQEEGISKYIRERYSQDKDYEMFLKVWAAYNGMSYEDFKRIYQTSAGGAG